MSPRAIGISVILAIVLAALGSAWLFWVQNSARVAMLSLNLGVAKFALQEPLPIPVLMGICLATGFVLGVICMLVLRMGRGRRRSDPYDTSSYGSPYDGDRATPDRV